MNETVSSLINSLSSRKDTPNRSETPPVRYIGFEDYAKQVKVSDPRLDTQELKGPMGINGLEVYMIINGQKILVTHQDMVYENDFKTHVGYVDEVPQRIADGLQKLSSMEKSRWPKASEPSHTEPRTELSVRKFGEDWK